MRGEIVNVGTELLMGEVTNTSFQYIAEQLRYLGIDLYYQVTVGDNHQRLVGALHNALQRAQLVITTGGLGPTTDDITVEGIAKALNLPLELNEDWLAYLERITGKYGLKLTENNKKQAYLPAGATPLANDKGTAPGVYLEHQGKIIIALPGPPQEMKNIFQKEVIPRLKEKQPSTQLYSRLFRMIGIGEADLETKIRDLIDNQTNLTLALYAKLGEVHLRLAVKAKSKEEAADIFAPTEKQLQERIGDYIYAYDEESLEETVGKLLLQQGLTLACAESCSGGLLGSRITNTPGSSAYFLGSIVAYDNSLKEKILKVEEKVLRNYGAVSKETAIQMAKGAIAATGADVAISITGIAGPGGGTEEKPVGTVFFSLAFRDNTRVEVWHRLLIGNREEIKYRTTQKALYFLWSELSKRGEGSNAH